MASLYKAKLNKQEADYSQLPSFESDLWSLGVLLLELVSKKRVKPFDYFQMKGIDLNKAEDIAKINTYLAVVEKGLP